MNEDPIRADQDWKYTTIRSVLPVGPAARCDWIGDVQDPSRRGGGFWALLEGFLNGLATWVLAIISIGVLFLLGSATLSKTSSSPLSSGLSSKMAPTSVLSSSTGYAPKEYVKAGLPPCPSLLLWSVPVDVLMAMTFECV